MADLNARYGDKTELTAEVLERLARGTKCGWFSFGEPTDVSLLMRKKTGDWFYDHQSMTVGAKSPRTLGDLYRLADALGVKLREDGNG